MKTRTYVCANCGGQFTAPPGDEEKAQAESLAMWGKRGDARGMAVVCEDCWQKIMAWYHSPGVKV
jgi:DNA-directed RNA polymerase subunit RPC12/RpoP